LEKFLVPPGKVDDRERAFTGENYDAIKPLVDMWCLISRTSSSWMA
jgi:hypothetical protein